MFLLGQAGKAVWFGYNTASDTLASEYGVQLSLVDDMANNVKGKPVRRKICV